MFRKEFIELVKIASKKSGQFYSDRDNLNKPNPFYIGFGNPNSDILILGKEKGFEQDNKDQLTVESINNPYEWNNYIVNDFEFYKTKFNKNSKLYLNAYYPYEGKMKSGHTWTKYNSLIQKIYFNKTFENNGFLRHTFISELNHVPSKYSNIKKFNSPTRLIFLLNKFFRSFKITILACGNYLSKKDIEDIFEVEFCNDLSKPREKLLIFKSNNRTIVNTRQLSMDVKNDYIDRIVEHIKRAM